MYTVASKSLDRLLGEDESHVNVTISVSDLSIGYRECVMRPVQI